MNQKPYNIYNEHFQDRDDGVRVYDNGLKKYQMVLDRTTSLWSIEAVDGTLPYPLRDLRFTNPRYAIIELKNHADRLPERQAIYKGRPKKVEAEE